MVADEQDRDREKQDREREMKEREAERKERERQREAELYEQGQEAMDQSRWDRAINAFDRVIELKGTKVDAALYWKAYSQNRQGLRVESLATIAELTRQRQSLPSFPPCHDCRPAQNSAVRLPRSVCFKRFHDFHFACKTLRANTQGTVKIPP